MTVSTLSSDLLNIPAHQLVRDIQNKTITARSVVEAYLAQIEHTRSSLHAYLRYDAQSALARATAIDDSLAGQADSPVMQGKLLGVPVSLKDLFVTKGETTTAGSKMLESWTPNYHGTQAQRLDNEQAIRLGKVSMDEFAMGSSNENSPFPVPANPWNSDYVAGGSSGGSAAAVAARTCSIALGSDTGGSVRQPASLCGVVGLKPTYGRISRFGMIAFASSLDQCGLLTRNVQDAALGLSALAGHDPKDATSLRNDAPDYIAACGPDIKGKRVGVDRSSIDQDALDPQVRRVFEQSLEVLKAAGAQIVDISLPNNKHGVATYYVLSAAEAASNLARYDGLRYGKRVSKDSLTDTYFASRSEGFGDEVKRRIMLGTFVLRANSYEQYYGRAMKVRTLICRDYDDAFSKVDVIASPTSPVPGFRHGERTGSPLAMYLGDIFTVGANLSGIPGISIPAGFSEPTAQAPRLPIGLQLLAPRLQEERLLSVAFAHESQTNWHNEIPPMAIDLGGEAQRGE